MSIQLSAPALPAIFDQVTHFLCDRLSERSEVLPRESRWIEVTAGDPEVLLQNWIEELLLIHETEGTLFRHSESTLEKLPSGSLLLRGHLWGEPFDPIRHTLRTAVPSRPFRRPVLRQDGETWQVELDLAPGATETEKSDEDPLAAAGGIAGG